MLTNNCKIKLLTVAMFLLFGACADKKGENQSSGSPATEDTRNDAGNKSEQNNSDRFSDVQVFEQVTEITKKHIRELLDHYHALTDALVREQTDNAADIGQKITEELESFDASALPEDQSSFYKTHVKKIKEASGEISSTTGIDQQREGLPALTQSLYSLAKAYQANQETLYYQYCPMAFEFEGGYWISNSEEVINPYFGDEMLNCGSVSETLPGK